jgi:hypothetical protein
VSEALGLRRGDIATIVRNGFKASLMTPSEKERASSDVDRVLAETA